MNVNTLIASNGGDWLEKFGEDWRRQLAELARAFEGAIVETQFPSEHPVDVPIVFPRREKLLDILRFMKSASGFEYGYLSDLTATDERPRLPRFDVVYNLFSPARRWRIRVKVRLGEEEPLPTITSLWSGANWAERELFDMFGIKVEGHPDLRRVLNDQRFEGHPLRKDYPIRKSQLFNEPEAINRKLLE